MEVGISENSDSKSQVNINQIDKSELRFIDGFIYDYSELEPEDTQSESPIEDNEVNTETMPKDLLSQLLESTETGSLKDDEEDAIDIEIDGLDATSKIAPSLETTEVDFDLEAEESSNDPLIQKMEVEIEFLQRLLTQAENETCMNISKVEAAIQKTELALREARTVTLAKFALSGESRKQKYIMAVIEKLKSLKTELEAIAQNQTTVKPVKVEWRKNQSVNAVVDQISKDIDEIMALVTQKETINAEILYANNLNKALTNKLQGLIKTVSGLSAEIDSSLTQRELKTPKDIMNSTRGKITNTLSRFTTQLPTYYNPRVKALLG